ncbi:hypothetical protein JD79_01792 [Geodermatophilus normandii]|uniref:Uncharacterized protein n=1 Tax=Geodermatophilus normandii TaxID=1137989 RepID=A0A317QIE2_9ACTN|nr:hypothetical protein [Geodermatophilus normandii]PWW22634.1 hypothetical protein JD79_01792 [Geodermatophilus normandii]
MGRNGGRADRWAHRAGRPLGRRGRPRRSPDTVAALVPARFAAYARVFHPAVRYDGDDDVHVRWDEVAAANGTTAHRLMQWPGITGSWEHLGEADQPGLWNDAPAEGHLVAHVARELVTVLQDQTTTPGECWFGWDDHGAADLPGCASPAPTCC